jgi:uncharacterized membrane protein
MVALVPMQILHGQLLHLQEFLVITLAVAVAVATAIQLAAQGVVVVVVELAPVLPELQIQALEVLLAIRMLMEEEPEVRG